MLFDVRADPFYVVSPSSSDFLFDVSTLFLRINMSPLLSGKTTDNKIDICSFSAWHAKFESDDWLARNQGSVFWWNNIFTCALLFQLAL